MYMSVFACMYVFMYVHHVRTWWMQRSEEGVPYPGTGVTDHPLASDLVLQLTISNLNPAFTESTRCRPPAMLARVTGQGLSTARDHRNGPASVFGLLSRRPAFNPEPSGKTPARSYQGPRPLVRQAPPFLRPALCCRTRRAGLTVNPTYTRPLCRGFWQ